MREIKNKVVVEGYLKENTLELTRNDRGEEVIRGNIVIAVDISNSCRVQFYTTHYKKMKPGETAPQPNKNYERLMELLPNNTMSIASIQKESSTITFDQAKEMATKVYAIATLQEYSHKNENGEVISSVTLKGMTGGLADKKPLDPKAQFTATVYIEKKTVNAEGKVTITGLIPEYDDTVSRIDFITGNKDADQYVDDHYEVGQTVELRGDIVNMVIKEAKTQNTANSFGRAAAEQYSTTFVREFRIVGGSGPWDEDSDLGISKAEIKAALTAKAAKIAEMPIRTTEVKNNTNVDDELFGGFQSAPAKSFSFDGQF